MTDLRDDEKRIEFIMDNMYKNSFIDRMKELLPPEMQFKLNQEIISMSKRIEEELEKQ